MYFDFDWQTEHIYLDKRVQWCMYGCYVLLQIEIRAWWCQYNDDHGVCVCVCACACVCMCVCVCVCVSNITGTVIRIIENKTNSKVNHSNTHKMQVHPETICSSRMTWINTFYNIICKIIRSTFIFDGSFTERDIPHVASILTLLKKGNNGTWKFITPILGKLLGNIPDITTLTHCGTVRPYMATYILVNIGSGNGVLHDSTKPLPEPMLTHHQCDQIRRK